MDLHFNEGNGYGYYGYIMSLEAPVKPGEDTACVGGGTKGLSKACWAGLGALQ